MCFTNIYKLRNKIINKRYKKIFYLLANFSLNLLFIIDASCHNQVVYIYFQIIVLTIYFNSMIHPSAVLHTRILTNVVSHIPQH